MFSMTYIDHSLCTNESVIQMRPVVSAKLSRDLSILTGNRTAQRVYSTWTLSHYYNVTHTCVRTL